MKKLDKYLDLARQRAAAFDSITEGINGVIKNVADAQQSHLDSAAAQTTVDSASNWLAHVAKNALEKGRKAGYAEACKDISPFLQNILSVINQEKTNLSNLIQETAEFIKQEENKGDVEDQGNEDSESLDEEKSSPEELSPLVLEES